MRVDFPALESMQWLKLRERCRQETKLRSGELEFDGPLHVVAIDLRPRMLKLGENEKVELRI